MNNENTKLDDIVAKIKNIWETKNITNCPFWESLTSSYYSNDLNAIKNNVFYSEISFYPDLIKYLYEHVSCNNTIKIIFFSTLLPRHYWNFPLSKSMDDKGNGRYFFISQTKQFLDTYREQLLKCVNLPDNKLKLMRVLIIADEPFFYKNTRLFSLEDLKEDNEYYLKVNENPMIQAWNSIIKQDFEINHRNPWFTYSAGCPMNMYHIWFQGHDNDYSKELKSNLENTNFYIFEKRKTNNRISVLDYYIEKLHTKTNGNENARVIVLTEKTKQQRNLFNNKIRTIHVSELKLSQEFKPDLGLIIINEGKPDEKTIILNTFMDLLNNIVKLEVVESNRKNYQELLGDISNIISNSKVLFPEKIKINGKIRKTYGE